MALRRLTKLEIKLDRGIKLTRHWWAHEKRPGKMYILESNIVELMYIWDICHLWMQL